MTNKEFGKLIMRLISKESLSRDEAREAFQSVLKGGISEIQQGAFLAALASKGETEYEVAGAWDAIYKLDTVKVSLKHTEPVVENSGTGMDTFKTFNISTAASLLAVGGGIRMARHGARAITSQCGTVDMAEALGVDVECPVGIVAESIQKAGIGLFNGMSSAIHPGALGRILSQVFFGSTLNIAASLANPALPRRAIRGVYNKEMILPVIKVMKAIGYERAVVLYGAIDKTDKGMDEASVCGSTYCAELKEDGDIEEYQVRPEDFGFPLHSPDQLMPSTSLEQEAHRFVRLLHGNENRTRIDAVILNSAFVFYVAGKAQNINEGIKLAVEILNNGSAFKALESWVIAQNRESDKGLQKLYSYL